MAMFSISSPLPWRFGVREISVAWQVALRSLHCGCEYTCVSSPPEIDGQRGDESLSSKAMFAPYYESKHRYLPRAVSLSLNTSRRSLDHITSSYPFISHEHFIFGPALCNKIMAGRVSCLTKVSEVSVAEIIGVMCFAVSPV